MGALYLALCAAWHSATLVAMDIHIGPIQITLTEPPPLQVLFGWTVGPPLRRRRTIMPLNLTCTTEQRMPVMAHPMTHGTSTQPGVPATLDGPLFFALQSGDGMAELAADGLSAWVMSDVPGVTTWIVSGDADVGAGVITIEDMVMLTVTSPMADNLGLTAGEAEPR